MLRSRAQPGQRLVTLGNRRFILGILEAGPGSRWTVGLTEVAAQAKGFDVIAVGRRLPATFRGWLHQADGGLVKLIVDRRSGVLVGATAVGPHGGEMLGFLNLAVHARVPLAELRRLIYAFPTFYGGIGEALGAYGRGLATVIDPQYQGFALFDQVGTAEHSAALAPKLSRQRSPAQPARG